MGPPFLRRMEDHGHAHAAASGGVGGDGAGAGHGRKRDSISHAVLCTSCIPLTFGLMRYPGFFNRQFGTIVLSILGHHEISGPSLVFTVSGAGFGIALSGMFFDITGDFFADPSETSPCSTQ